MYFHACKRRQEWAYGVRVRQGPTQETGQGRLPAKMDTETRPSEANLCLPHLQGRANLVNFILQREVSTLAMKSSRHSTPVGPTYADSTNPGSKIFRNKEKFRKCQKAKPEFAVLVTLHSTYIVLGIISNLE